MVSSTSADQVDLSNYPTCLCCTPQLQSAARRISREMSRRGFIAGVGASLTSFGLVQPAAARVAPFSPTPPIVFRNFLLFDGKSKALRGGLHLLVEGNRIKLIVVGDGSLTEWGRSWQNKRRAFLRRLGYRLASTSGRGHGAARLPRPD